MLRGKFFCVFFCTAIITSFTAGAQSVPREVLRGEVSVELEPVYLLHLGISSPLDKKTADLWALEDSATAFSGMIYGWIFEYEPGERVREISEYISLTPLGRIEMKDDRLRITNASVENEVLYTWCDYNLSGEQQFRMTAWNAAGTKKIKAMGFAPLQGKDGVTDRKMVKEAALEDALKKAIRAELRATQKNRPRMVRGYIALSEFPLYRIFHGNWAAQASFRLRVTEIIPYAAY
ncbi:MAG: hypothetical protein LBD07_04505 [Spirochaetaceae bacterium]|jgi:hypothetical protein|nr:hypothetical protein [Spirochaetaceae bacterium]